MAFHDALFNEDIDYGYEGGPGFQTIIQQTASAHEYRIARASQGRHRYSIDMSLLSGEEWAEVRKFAFERRGSLHSFRLKDWLDFASTESGQLDDAVTNIDQYLGDGDGTTTQFQLRKVYERDAINPYYRPITLPKAGTVVVAVDGSTAAFTLSNPGGVVTLSAAPTEGAVVTAGFQFHVPVRFGQDVDAWLRARWSDANNIEFSRASMIEVLNEVETVERHDPGGSQHEAISSDFTISAGMPYFISRTVTVANVNCFLPPPDRLVGGVIYCVHNHADSTHDITILDDAGGAVSSAIPPDSVVHVALIWDGVTAEWLVFA